jgi:predicted nucleotidyltransferase component of viral defense system
MTRDFAKSIKTKLLNIARKEELDYQVLLIRYLYERLLYRLSVSRYRNNFCLKGGTLLYALEREFSRPTLDIDLLGLKIKNDENVLKEIFTEIMSIPFENDGVVFDVNSLKAENLVTNKAYHGVRLIYNARLDSIIQTMKIDIGFGDVIIPSTRSLFYPTLIQNLPVPDILAYPLETVIAEKFHAMLDLAESNSRYKDFYDVYHILSKYELDKKTITDAIRATIHNRETIFTKNHPLFSDDFAKNQNRNMQWLRFLKKIKNKENFSFETVMSLIKIYLQPIYECIF